MAKYLKKFSNESEYNTYINGNNVYVPNVSLINNSDVRYFTERDYYTKQYLTFEILEDGYIGLNDMESRGLTVQYNKNNTGWTNFTSAPCNLLTEEITVDGKEGTYTYGGYATEKSMYYWENNGDKLYYYRNKNLLGLQVYDDDNNRYQVLTTKDAPQPITTEITVDGKSGTYTFGGFDAEEMYMYYWENNGDKLYGNENYIVIGLDVRDSEWTRWRVLTTKDAPNNNFISVTEGDTLCFKGDNSTYNGTQFVSTGKFNIKGNIMSLIDSTDFTTATTLVESHTFSQLFVGNRNLVSAKNLVLPATTLTNDCYWAMFRVCTSLTTAPELPATTLATNCYSSMFEGCTSLTTAPELPATTLATSCYTSMFRTCTSLTTAPELPATTLATNCYFCMFEGCTSLNYIKCLVTNISASNCTQGWVQGVSSTGTFVKDASMNDLTTGRNGIPSGWTVENIGFGLSKKFISIYESGGSEQVILYSTYNNWTATTSDNWISLSQSTGSTGETTIVITATSTSSPRNGEVSFYDGNKTIILSVKQNDNYLTPLTFNIISDGNIVWKTSNTSIAKTISYSKDNGVTWTPITATTAGVSIPVVSGDVITFKGNNETYGSYYYYNTFGNSTAKFELKGNIMSLLFAEDFVERNSLVSDYTFDTLFKGCTGLTSANKLVLISNILTNNCYRRMFQNCTNLTSAPELPSTTLGQNCYGEMFWGCSGLTTAPELPATTLATSCYTSMFQGCRSLTTTPDLPATTLANNCYAAMFDSCISLTTAPDLPATTLAAGCYSGMFQGCTGLTTAPELPATTLVHGCYYYMFWGCKSLTTAPVLPATTLADYCYERMFQSCNSLNYIKCLATNISATNCTNNWLTAVSSTGTFVKNASMSNWTTGGSGIPSGWTVQDA